MMRLFPAIKHTEFGVFKKLNSPRKVQDFIDGLRMNFEKKRETCRSPLMTLRAGEAHCAEGAMLAAAIFWYHGAPPLLLDLKVAENKGDVDHVVTLFKEDGRWGAISKTNHAVLRYRDPIYKTVRELALSYFNEYFLENGLKTLRTYSAPFSLLNHHDAWLTARGNMWDMMSLLDESKHFDILEKGTVRRLRRADPIEIQASELVQWQKK
jgi:hypothetical protein